MLFCPGSVVFLDQILLADGISSNPEKVDEVRDWLVAKNAKELHSFLGLEFYYHQFVPDFAHMAKFLHQLIGPMNVKKVKVK